MGQGVMRWLRARTGGVMPWLAVGTLLGVLFVTAPAAADLPSPDPDAKPVAASPSAAPTANPGETSELAEAEAPPVVTPKGHRKRPVFMALLAVGFLIFASVVGANDKPEGDAPNPLKPAA